MKKRIMSLSNLFTVFVIGLCININAQKNESKLEIVSEMSIRPGNVAVNNKGVVFSTIHPLGNPSMQLVKIKDKLTYEPFPDKTWQREATEKATDNSFDTPLGITTDENGNVWVVDMGLNIGKTRLFCFNSITRKRIFSLSFPSEVAPKGSFIQDLAVDIKGGFVYLADIADPGILVVSLKTKNVRRLKQHQSFLSENVDMIIENQVINFGGKPARVGINPITISKDKQTIFYGAMNGKNWYSLSAQTIRKNKNDDEVLATIKKVANKPISDGALTDEKGNHYFTNLNEKGIDRWNVSTKTLEPLIRDNRLLWTDNLSLNNGYIYIAVNQLYQTPAFTGSSDLGKPPYYIYRIKVN